MNATSRDEIRQSAAAREPVDPKMDQIRELLVGDLVRQNEARMAALEFRIGQLENALSEGVAELTRRVEALAQETEIKRRAGVEELARHVASFGESILRGSKA